MSFEQNPWNTLADKEIYDNPWIKVTEYQVLNPAGNPGIYGVVHFKNKAVGVVPYEDGSIWMVGQYRYALETYSWEIPEGGCPPDEAPLDCAKRELKEETGLEAANYSSLLQLHTSNSVTDEWGIVYLATDLSQGIAAPEETESLQIRKMSLEEVFRMVEENEIMDSLTVAAIYKLMYLKAMGAL